MTSSFRRQTNRVAAAAIPTLSAMFENRPLHERLRSYSLMRAARPSVRRSEAEALARIAQVDAAFAIEKDRGVGHDKENADHE